MKMGPMSRIVQSMACILFPAVIVFGSYLIIHGHLTPGGGFQGGAVAASAIALMIVSFGSRYFNKNTLSAMESTGLLMFIVLGMMGLGTTFLYNFMANSGGLFGAPVLFGSNAGNINTSGTVAILNIAVGLEVVGALGLVLITLAKGPEEEIRGVDGR